MKDDTPSSTALIVALALLVLGGDSYGRQKCPPGSVAMQTELLRASGLPGGRYPWIICNPIFAKLARWLFVFTFHAGFLEAVGLRKCWMEEQVRTFLTRTKRHGHQQVLIVGAGYDTLALRLSVEYPKVQFWEVDHPATGKVKKRGLEAIMGAQPRPNLHTVAADLTKCSLPEALSKHEKYDSTAATVVVIEGLLMYLTEEQVRGLFADVVEVVGKKGGSMACFDFFGWNPQANQADVGWAASFHHDRVSRKGEAWKWGIKPDQLPSFFESTPWTVTGPTYKTAMEHMACVELNQ